MGATKVVVLVAAVAFTLVFAILAGVFGGFVKKAVGECPALTDESKSAHTWVHVCTWCTVFSAAVALVVGFVLTRESRTAAEEVSVAPGS